MNADEQEKLKPFMNKIMSFIDTLNKSDAITCNSECQKRRKAEKLEDNLIRARQLKTDAPILYQKAVDAMYRFDNGDSAFGDLQRNREKQKIKNKLKTFVQKYKSIQDRLNSMTQLDGSRLQEYNGFLRSYVLQEEERLEERRLQSAVANRMSEFKIARLEFFQFINYWTFYIILFFSIILLLYYRAFRGIKAGSNILYSVLIGLFIVYILQNQFANIMYYIRNYI